MRDAGIASSTALKALRVLEAVAATPGPSALGEIAERAGLDKSTTYRMLTTLDVAGYVRQDETSRRYRLSYHVVSLSRNLLAENEVFQLTRAAMEELAADTGESIDLSVLDSTEVVIIQRVKGAQLVAVDFQVGDRSPLHCTSIGKAVLAYQPIAFVEAVLARPLQRRAACTITDPVAMSSELEGIRARGYAIDDHEFSDSMRCIAAPIFERDTIPRMGLSISGPDGRFTLGYLDDLRPRLLQATRELSAHLGGIPALTRPGAESRAHLPR